MSTDEINTQVLEKTKIGTSANLDENTKGYPVKFSEFCEATNLREVIVKYIQEAKPNSYKTILKKESKIILTEYMVYNKFYESISNRSCVPACFIQIRDDCPEEKRRRILSCPGISNKSIIDFYPVKFEEFCEHFNYEEAVELALKRDAQTKGTSYVQIDRNSSKWKNAAFKVYTDFYANEAKRRRHPVTLKTSSESLRNKLFKFATVLKENNCKGSINSNQSKSPIEEKKTKKSNKRSHQNVSSEEGNCPKTDEDLENNELNIPNNLNRKKPRRDNKSKEESQPEIITKDKGEPFNASRTKTDKVEENFPVSYEAFLKYTNIKTLAMEHLRRSNKASPDPNDVEKYSKSLYRDFYTKSRQSVAVFRSLFIWFGCAEKITSTTTLKESLKKDATKKKENSEQQVLLPPEKPIIQSVVILNPQTCNPVIPPKSPDPQPRKGIPPNNLSKVREASSIKTEMKTSPAKQTENIHSVATIDYQAVERELQKIFEEESPVCEKEVQANEKVCAKLTTSAANCSTQKEANHKAPPIQKTLPSETTTICNDNGRKRINNRNVENVLQKSAGNEAKIIETSMSDGKQKMLNLNGLRMNSRDSSSKVLKPQGETNPSLNENQKLSAGSEPVREKTTSSFDVTKQPVRVNKEPMNIENKIKRNPLSQLVKQQVRLGGTAEDTIAADKKAEQTEINNERKSKESTKFRTKKLKVLLKRIALKPPTIFIPKTFVESMRHIMANASVARTVDRTALSTQSNINANTKQTVESNKTPSIRQSRIQEKQIITETDDGGQYWQFPVTFQEFCKCTNYESLVDNIICKEFLNKPFRQKVAREIYWNFYTKPQNRDQLKLRLKPLPMKKRSKILDFARKYPSTDDDNHTNLETQSSSSSEDSLVTSNNRKMESRSEAPIPQNNTVMEEQGTSTNEPSVANIDSVPPKVQSSSEEHSASKFLFLVPTIEKQGPSNKLSPSHKTGTPVVTPSSNDPLVEPNNNHIESRSEVAIPEKNSQLAMEEQGALPNKPSVANDPVPQVVQSSSEEHLSSKFLFLVPTMEKESASLNTPSSPNSTGTPIVQPSSKEPLVVPTKIGTSILKNLSTLPKTAQGPPLNTPAQPSSKEPLVASNKIGKLILKDLSTLLKNPQGPSLNMPSCSLNTETPTLPSCSNAPLGAPSKSLESNNGALFLQNLSTLPKTTQGPPLNTPSCSLNIGTPIVQPSSKEPLVASNKIGTLILKDLSTLPMTTQGFPSNNPSCLDSSGAQIVQTISKDSLVAPVNKNFESDKETRFLIDESSLPVLIPNRTLLCSTDLRRVRALSTESIQTGGLHDRMVCRLSQGQPPPNKRIKEIPAEKGPQNINSVESVPPNIDVWRSSNATPISSTSYMIKKKENAMGSTIDSGQIPIKKIEGPLKNLQFILDESENTFQIFPIANDPIELDD